MFAYATPTFPFATRTAHTTDASDISFDRNSSSSNACNFPGDADFTHVHVPLGLLSS